MFRTAKIPVLLLFAAALSGCGTRPNDLYFSGTPQPVPAPVIQSAPEPTPPEVVNVPDLTAPVLGQEIFDTNPPPATNIEAHVSAPFTNAPPQMAAPSRWGSGWVPLPRFATESGLGSPQRTIVANTSRYTIATRNGNFIITMGSKLARLAGANVWLAFPAQVVHGQPCVNALDAEKTLQPLAEVSAIKSSTKTIVIDAGHGGADSGTRGPHGEREKDYTLDWALRVEHLLTNAGWRVVMTRRTDVELPLPERVAIAERARADLFISLHFNSAAPHPGPSGIETYCLTPPGMPSTLLRGYPDDTRQTYPNNVFDRANLQLASKLQRELVSETHMLDDGIKRARFMGVLRNQNRPAILVEGGYLSNPAEFNQISSAKFRQRLAEAVARSLKW